MNFGCVFLLFVSEENYVSEEREIKIDNKKDNDKK